MNLKFEKLAKEILGEGSRYDQDSQHSLFSRREKALEKGGGRSRAYVVHYTNEDGEKIKDPFEDEGDARAKLNRVKKIDPQAKITGPGLSS